MEILDFPDQLPADWISPKALKQFQAERSEAVDIGLMLWLVPLFTVAGVGYTSRWVYRGFRPQVESPADVVSPEKHSRRSKAARFGVGVGVTIAMLLFEALAPQIWVNDTLFPNWPRMLAAGLVAGLSAYVGRFVAVNQKT